MHGNFFEMSVLKVKKMTIALEKRGGEQKKRWLPQSLFESLTYFEINQAASFTTLTLVTLFAKCF